MIIYVLKCHFSFPDTTWNYMLFWYRKFSISLMTWALILSIVQIFVRSCKSETADQAKNFWSLIFFRKFEASVSNTIVGKWKITYFIYWGLKIALKFKSADLPLSSWNFLFRPSTLKKSLLNNIWVFGKTWRIIQLERLTDKFAAINIFFRMLRLNFDYF
jgi:hypothetical protein